MSHGADVIVKSCCSGKGNATSVGRRHRQILLDLQKTFFFRRFVAFCRSFALCSSSPSPACLAACCKACQTIASTTLTAACCPLPLCVKNKGNRSVGRSSDPPSSIGSHVCVAVGVAAFAAVAAPLLCSCSLPSSASKCCILHRRGLQRITFKCFVCSILFSAPRQQPLTTTIARSRQQRRCR